MACSTGRTPILNDFLLVHGFWSGGAVQRRYPKQANLPYGPLPCQHHATSYIDSGVTTETGIPLLGSLSSPFWVMPVTEAMAGCQFLATFGARGVPGRSMLCALTHTHVHPHLASQSPPRPRKSSVPLQLSVHFNLQPRRLIVKRYPAHCLCRDRRLICMSQLVVLSGWWRVLGPTDLLH